MQPTFDFFAGSYQASDDATEALFGRPLRPRSAGSARTVTCRVCERRDLADLTRVLLCSHCGRDLDASRTHVQQVLAGHQTQVENAWCDLQAALPDDLDDALSVRWGAFQEACERGDGTAQAAMQKARAGMQGPLADLIRLWCAYLDAKGIYEERCRWAAAADLALALNEE